MKVMRTNYNPRPGLVSAFCLVMACSSFYCSDGETAGSGAPDANNFISSGSGGTAPKSAGSTSAGFSAGGTANIGGMAGGAGGTGGAAGSSVGLNDSGASDGSAGEEASAGDSPINAGAGGEADSSVGLNDSGVSGGDAGQDTGADSASVNGDSATGAAGSGVSVSPSCKIPTWPTPSGSTVTISGTRSVTSYDGNGALHEGTLEDCSTGDQSSTDPILEVADGGSVKNVIFGKRVGDGIHCKGSCTIENVWFQYVCDDAITMLGGSGKTMTIRNSGFKRARDKTVQHNGTGSTVVIDNVYVETAGKLYRSCGEGCSGGARNATISNVTAIALSQVAGVSTNDKATLSNICAYRTGTICVTYKPGSDTKANNGANGTAEGPNANCVYEASDTHALVDRVSGAFSTDVLCTGTNSAKTGSTATACVPGFNDCLKPCTPGGYGFKQLGCSGNTYSESVACALPTDGDVRSHLAGDNSANATSTVSKNAPCTTQWAWAKDSSDDADYCVCVTKPGYYNASSGWFVWDCQSVWW